MNREKSSGANFESHASKRVSFVLATKNRAERLQKTLEMHRELVHPDDELIIIDGLSTDHTAEVVNQYADLVDVFISEPDTCPAHAFNKGMLLSRGKYIKLQTDDDVIYPEAMEQAVQVLEEHPEVDLLMCGGTRQRGDQLSTVYVPPGTNYGEKVETVFRYGASGVGFIIRRSTLARIGLFETTNWVADKDLVLRAVSQGANVKFCRINLFHHPIYEHSVTVSKNREFQADDNRLRRQYYPLSSYWRYRLKRWYSTGFLAWLGHHSRLKSIARIPLDIAGKISGQKQGEKASPDVEGFTWDGGFS